MTVEAVALTNVSSRGGLLPHPGILRCNFSNPCRGFSFDHVVVESNRNWSTGHHHHFHHHSHAAPSERAREGGPPPENYSYVCDYVTGAEVTAGSSPLPDAGKHGTCTWDVTNNTGTAIY